MFRTTAALLALTLAAPAMADRLSYNYLQLGYQRIDIDVSGISVDGDGFGVGGSFEVGENVFIFAGLATADFDFGVDFNTVDAGIGYRVDVSPNADFFATLGYARAEVDVSGFGSADDSGIGASIGMRGMVSDKVELFGSLSYVDFGDGGDGTSVGGGFWYNINNQFAVGVNGDFEDDVSAYGIAGRFYFGQ